jgi:hypothetical protein
MKSKETEVVEGWCGRVANLFLFARGVGWQDLLVCWDESLLHEILDAFGEYPATFWGGLLQVGRMGNVVLMMLVDWRR